MKGIINIRKLSCSSLGLTLPKELTDSLKVKKGIYTFNLIASDTNTFTLKLELLQEK